MFDELLEKIQAIEIIEGQVLARVPEYKEVEKRVQVAGRWAWDSNPFSSQKNIETKLTDIERDHIFRYVFRDAEPTGAIARSLEKAVQLSKPSKKEVVLFRGIRLNSSEIKSIIDDLNKGETSVFRTKRPSSWTNSDSAAWDFAKSTGYHSGLGKAGLILKVLAPRGTKGFVTESFGLGMEVVLSKTTKVKIVKVEVYRSEHRALGTIY